MKKYLAIAISAIVISCHSQDDLKLISNQKIEIDSLKKILKEKADQANFTSYVYIVIKSVKATKRIVPEFRSKYDNELLLPSYETEDLDTTENISLVQEIIGINEDKKFQALDKMEDEIITATRRSFTGSYIKKTLERKIFVFDTYSEASKERAKFIESREYLKL